MPYMCDLGTGQRVYLDNQGNQTIATTVSSNPGQQQQSSSSFQTGSWTAPPEAYQTPAGTVLKLTTAQGEHFIQIQGTSMGMVGGISTHGQQQMQMQQVSTPTPPTPPTMQPMQPMQPIPSMQPMQPMPPMTMGNMQMSTNPMAMRMGDMEMQMGTIPAAAAPSPPAATRRFCSQCGVPVKESDRFCASCGHKLD